jgi:hypothetical protein
MFGDGRSCLELALQLQTVESVIHKAKRTLTSFTWSTASPTP